MSLNQNVSHGFDAFSAINVSTRVGVIRISSSTKPDSGVVGVAIVFVVTKDTDSRPVRRFSRSVCIEPFHVAVGL